MLEAVAVLEAVALEAAEADVGQPDQTDRTRDFPRAAAVVAEMLVPERFLFSTKCRQGTKLRRADCR